MSKGNRVFRLNRWIKRLGDKWHTLQTNLGTVYVPNECDGRKLPQKLSHRSKRSDRHAHDNPRGL